MKLCQFKHNFDQIKPNLNLQGQVLSQMLRKSVETRDWLNTVEPRTVRAVMKRVVEETTCIDAQVLSIDNFFYVVPSSEETSF